MTNSHPTTGLNPSDQFCSVSAVSPSPVISVRPIDLVLSAVGMSPDFRPTPAKNSGSSTEQSKGSQTPNIDAIRISPSHATLHTNTRSNSGHHVMTTNVPMHSELLMGSLDHHNSSQSQQHEASGVSKFGSGHYNTPLPLYYGNEYIDHNAGHLNPLPQSEPSPVDSIDRPIRPIHEVDNETPTVAVIGGGYGPSSHGNDNTGVHININHHHGSVQFSEPSSPHSPYSPHSPQHNRLDNTHITHTTHNSIYSTSIRNLATTTILTTGTVATTAATAATHSPVPILQHQQQLPQQQQHHLQPITLPQLHHHSLNANININTHIRSQSNEMSSPPFKPTPTNPQINMTYYSTAVDLRSNRRKNNHFNDTSTDPLLFPHPSSKSAAFVPNLFIRGTYVIPFVYTAKMSRDILKACCKTSPYYDFLSTPLLPPPPPKPNPKSITISPLVLFNSVKNTTLPESRYSNPDPQLEPHQTQQLSPVHQARSVQHINSNGSVSYHPCSTLTTHSYAIPTSDNPLDPIHYQPNFVPPPLPSLCQNIMNRIEPEMTSNIINGFPQDKPKIKELSQVLPEAITTLPFRPVGGIESISQLNCPMTFVILCLNPIEDDCGRVAGASPPDDTTFNYISPTPSLPASPRSINSSLSKPRSPRVNQRVGLNRAKVEFDIETISPDQFTYLKSTLPTLLKYQLTRQLFFPLSAAPNTRKTELLWNFEFVTPEQFPALYRQLELSAVQTRLDLYAAVAQRDQRAAADSTLDGATRV